MAGPSPRSWFLDVKDANGAEIEAAKVVGRWVDANTSRTDMFRDYAPYDGKNGKWTKMAEERFDRCYHSVALLLPDGRVMSGGGGEYNEPGIRKEYCLINAQLFEPPYLHKEGSRPVIKDYPGRDLVYG